MFKAICKLILKCFDFHVFSYCLKGIFIFIAFPSNMLLLIHTISGSAVSLLLDQGFKSKQSCYFHPLTNDVTIGMIDTTITSFTYNVSSLSCIVVNKYIL